MNLCQSFGSSEDGVGEVGFSEGDVAEVGSSEVKSYFFVLSSPNVPGVNSLSEQIKLLLVCHGVVSLLCGAFIIERCRLMRKIISFCLFLPGAYGVFIMVYMLCSWKLGVSTLVLEVFHGVDES